MGEIASFEEAKTMHKRFNARRKMRCGSGIQVLISGEQYAKLGPRQLDELGDDE